MMRSHSEACSAIVAVSEPWKTLRERIDFSKYMALNQAYVYLKEGEPAGFIIFTPDPVFARGGYIRAVAVDPVMRRHGIGEKLLAFAETVIARRSPNAYLCVSSFNRRGQMFYRSLGYTRVGSLPDLIVQGASEYIYWKRLRPLPLKNRRIHRL
ncbi:MAG TPA: GNAT family N-acetyltransferase [Nitrospirota bacterium]|nr:GNAT family N-acetyltransferase [Nitrospirota bacterium]